MFLVYPPGISPYIQTVEAWSVVEEADVQVWIQVGDDWTFQQELYSWLSLELKISHRVRYLNHWALGEGTEKQKDHFH